MKKVLLLASFSILLFRPIHAETMLTCRQSIDPANKHGDTGSSLRLEYNVGADLAFNGFWMKLGPADRGNNFDASNYRKLTFWLKGDKTAGIPTRFKIELKGDAGDVIGKYYVSNIGSEWMKVEVPLDIYAQQGVQLAALNELTVVFENKAAVPATKGAILIDDITLEGDGDSKVIADFNSQDMNNLGGHWGTFTP